MSSRCHFWSALGLSSASAPWSTERRLSFISVKVCWAVILNVKTETCSVSEWLQSSLMWKTMLSRQQLPAGLQGSHVVFLCLCPHHVCQRLRLQVNLYKLHLLLLDVMEFSVHHRLNVKHSTSYLRGKRTSLRSFFSLHQRKQNLTFDSWITEPHVQFQVLFFFLCGWSMWEMDDVIHKKNTLEVYVQRRRCRPCLLYHF